MITVNDLMTVDPQTIAPDTTLRRIIEIMKQENCRQLPIAYQNDLATLPKPKDLSALVCSHMYEPNYQSYL
jgi:predicted transcriptional regulator